MNFKTLCIAELYFLGAKNVVRMVHCTVQVYYRCSRRYYTFICYSFIVFSFLPLWTIPLWPVIVIAFVAFIVFVNRLRLWIEIDFSISLQVKRYYFVLVLVHRAPATNSSPLTQRESETPLCDFMNSINCSQQCHR